MPLYIFVQSLAVFQARKSDVGRIGPQGHFKTKGKNRIIDISHKGVEFSSAAYPAPENNLMRVIEKAKSGSLHVEYGPTDLLQRVRNFVDLRAVDVADEAQRNMKV